MERINQAVVSASLVAVLLVGNANRAQAQSGYCDESCRRMAALATVATVGGVVAFIALSHHSSNKAKAAKRAAPPDHLSVVYDPTSARVNYHVVMVPQAYCGATWSGTARLQSGQLPPGLTFQAGSGRIEGTPDLQGTWRVHVLYTNLECRGHTYPDHVVDLTITIAP